MQVIFSTSASASIPAAARVIEAGGNILSIAIGSTDFNLSSVNGFRGLTTDGDFFYYRPLSDSGVADAGVICRVALDGSGPILLSNSFGSDFISPGFSVVP